MRRITDIPLFKISNKGNKVTDQMLAIPINSTRVDNELLSDAINIIDRRFSYPLKNRVIADYQSGRIVPVFNKNITLTPFIPTFMKVYNNRVTSIVNLSPVATLTKDGALNIDNRTLFAMLQTASILLEYANNFENIKINTKLAIKGAEVYSKLLFKILDKTFAVNLNRQLADTVSFMTAKFFLIYLMERANDNSTNDIAYQCTSGQTSKNFLINQDEDLDQSIYMNGITDFIQKGLATISGLKKLSSRHFLAQWLSMYGNSTLLSLEYLPYFYHMVFSSMVGGRLNSEYVIENLASKQIIELNNELSKIMK